MILRIHSSYSEASVMGVGLVLSITALFLIILVPISMEMWWRSEFHPPDNGGPDGSAGSGTHLTA